jgi:hypothetical protein
MDNKDENAMRGGEKESVLSWGRGPLGEGGTLHPNIYNVLFI